VETTCPRRARARGSTQQEEVGDSKSLAYNNQIQEVTSEPSIGEGQPQKDKEAGLRGNQETSAALEEGGQQRMEGQVCVGNGRISFWILFNSIISVQVF
jgi:hypothetical protein